MTAAANADDDSGYVAIESDFTPFISWLRTASEEKGIPGAALAIVTREGITYLDTWGVKHIATGDTVDPDSIFRIASMSKTFAGAAATLLVDQELQSWDTRVEELFPQIQLGTATVSREITLKHIVSQSTGLMPHSYSNMLDDGVAYETIKNQFHKIPKVCAPGSCYTYQNVVFSLIGDVVELSTGDSYRQFLQERIFKPLGMRSASVGIEPYLDNPEATFPHRQVRGRWRTTTTNPAYYTVAPASGINAGIFDMTIWLRANLGAFPDVLSADFLAELHEPVISTPYGNYFNRWSGLEKAYYAIGWRVFDYKGLRAIHHGGGVRGYRSEMVFVPRHNIGMVLLLNGESNLANDVVPAFLDSLSNSI